MLEIILGKMGSQVWCCLSCGRCDGLIAGIGTKNYMIWMVNLQDVQITIPVDDVIKCLPDAKALGCTTKYWAHPKFRENFYQSSNLKILRDLNDNILASPQMQTQERNLTQNMPVPDTKPKDTVKHVGTDSSVWKYKITTNFTISTTSILGNL